MGAAERLPRWIRPVPCRAVLLDVLRIVRWSQQRATQASPVKPPTQVPDGVAFATFADPEGHLVGLVKE
jgi:predicted enzyme related to lactoylglutathione lyase